MGRFSELPGLKAIESSGVMERAMGIETAPKNWEIWRASRRLKSTIPQSEKQGS